MLVGLVSHRQRSLPNTLRRQTEPATRAGHLTFRLNHQAHFLVTSKNVVDYPVLEKFLNDSTGVDISVV
jgi:hypothetical protein